MKHWLGGIVKCSSCGSSLMAGLNSTRYQCGNYGRGKCLDSHYIKTTALEQAVYDALEKVLTDDSELNFEIRAKDKDNAPSQKTLIEEQLRKLDFKEDRIKQAYRDGIDTLEEYKDNKECIKKERESLLIQLNNIQEDNPDNTAEMLDRISNVLEIIKDENQDKLTRANAIRSVVDHMVYDKANDTLEVHFFLQK